VLSVKEMTYLMYKIFIKPSEYKTIVVISFELTKGTFKEYIKSNFDFYPTPRAVLSSDDDLLRDMADIYTFVVKL
jgi:hypothetical protein